MAKRNYSMPLRSGFPKRCDLTESRSLPAPKLCPLCRVQFLNWAGIATVKELHAFLGALAAYRDDCQNGRVINDGR